MDENTVFGAENAENMPKKPSKKPLRDFFDVFEAVILAVVASLFIMTFLFKTGYVDGHSMDTTMADGDRYFVSDLFYTPARGDIIVFEPARNRRQFRHSLRQKNHRRCGRPFGDKVR